MPKWLQLRVSKLIWWTRLPAQQLHHAHQVQYTHRVISGVILGCSLSILKQYLPFCFLSFYFGSINFDRMHLETMCADDPRPRVVVLQHGVHFSLRTQKPMEFVLGMLAKVDNVTKACPFPIPVRYLWLSMSLQNEHLDRK